MSEGASFGELIGRVRAGDALAAAEVVRRYEPALRRAVRARLRRDPRLCRLLDSVDVSQSVLASFFVRAALGQWGKRPRSISSSCWRPSPATRSSTRPRSSARARHDDGHNSSRWPRGACPQRAPATRPRRASCSLEAAPAAALAGGAAVTGAARRGRAIEEIAAALGGNPDAARVQLAHEAVARVSRRNWDWTRTAMSDTQPLTERLQDDQSLHWRAGERPLVESYLAAHPELRDDSLLDLLNHEVLLREERGEAPGLAEYLGRFPHLAAPLHDLFEVHALLEAEAGAADTPTLVVPGGTAAPAATPAVPGYEVLKKMGRALDDEPPALLATPPALAGSTPAAWAWCGARPRPSGSAAAFAVKVMKSWASADPGLSAAVRRRGRRSAARGHAPVHRAGPRDGPAPGRPAVLRHRNLVEGAHAGGAAEGGAGPGGAADGAGADLRPGVPGGGLRPRPGRDSP